VGDGRDQVRRYWLEDFSGASMRVRWGDRQGEPEWIITVGSLPRLEGAGLPVSVLDADFDNPRTLLLGERVDEFLPMASPAMVFTSEISLADALSGGQVPAAVTWVLLDLEHWPLTPGDEQADPIGTFSTAGLIRHSPLGGGAASAAAMASMGTRST
jgi:hypothetical protein